MTRRGPRLAYRKLGPRYPALALVALFQLAYLVVLGTVGLLRLYQDMTTGEFWLLAGAALALMAVDNIVQAVLVRRMLRPADAWLQGDRDDETTLRAWRCLVDLPVRLVRDHWKLPVLLAVVPWCALCTWLLELPWWSFFILFAGGLVALAYGIVLRFFGAELALRPVVEDIARTVPERAELPRAGVSLRFKLLAGLPLINIVTGVVVAGLSSTETTELRDLGLDVLVAVVVAFTVSFELTVLLTRSILAPLQDLRDATQRLGQGDFSARVPVLSTDETGALGAAFNTMAAGLAERERLHEAFGSYVDPDVTEKVLREGAVLEGEERMVSVLFLDIRDFTAFAERSSARVVVARLNDFWERVVPIVLEHGGHANKFIGDGLLAVFGAPDRLADHADRAVAAALEIARTVRATYGDELEIGIGVNSGAVIVGTVGGGGRLEFTVIGDPVNTAARVERATRETGDEVLITEATRRLLTRDFGPLEEREEVELRGKTEPVRLWAPVVAARDARRRARGGRAGVVRFQPRT